MLMDVLCDACVPRKCVEALREIGYDVYYINESYNPSMPDNEVKQIGYALGIPIATNNIKHFLDYDELIPLKPRKYQKQAAEVVKYLRGK